MADTQFNSHQSASPYGRGYGQRPGDEPYKRGLNTKLPLPVGSHGMPVRFVLGEGSTADCHYAQALIKTLPPSICWLTRLMTLTISGHWLP